MDRKALHITNGSTQGTFGGVRGKVGVARSHIHSLASYRHVRLCMGLPEQLDALSGDGGEREDGRDTVRRDAVRRRLHLTHLQHPHTRR